MSNNKSTDERTNKAIKAVKNSKTYPENSDISKLADKIARNLATEVYKKTKQVEALQIYGLKDEEIEVIKRSRGAPSKNMYSNIDIVHLVHKQQLQAGLSFTDGSENDRENSPCFKAVAVNTDISVHTIIRQYKLVSEEDRVSIKSRLKKVLSEHGLLHERHMNK